MNRCRLMIVAALGALLVGACGAGDDAAPSVDVSVLGDEADDGSPGDDAEAGSTADADDTDGGASEPDAPSTASADSPDAEPSGDGPVEVEGGGAIDPAPSVRVGGAIDIALDFHPYTFTGTTGQRFAVDVTAINGACNPDDEWYLDIVLLDPSGDRIGGRGDVYGSGGGCRAYGDDWELETDGEHTIEFRGASGESRSQTGTYEAIISELRLEREAIDLDVGPVQVSGSIDLGLDRDSYTFTGTTGQRISVDVTSINGSCNPDDEWYLDIVLLDPDGERIGERGDVYASGGGCRAYGDGWELASDGEHTVQFRGVDGEDRPQTGTYEALIADLRLEQEAIDLDAGPVEIAGGIDLALDRDSYTFTGTTGQRISVDLTSINGGCEDDDEWYLDIVLLDPDGERIGSTASVYGSGGGCRAYGDNWQLETDGEHTIQFRGASGEDRSPTGTYEALMSKLGG